MLFFRRTLAQRRALVESAESALQHDESEFQRQVDFCAQRMNELTLLGAKVQAQSAAVAEQYARLDAERSLIESARAEAQTVIDSVQRASASASAKGDQLRAEKSKQAQEKIKLKQEREKLKQDKENALKQIVNGIATRSSQLPSQLLSPTMKFELHSPNGGGLLSPFGAHDWPSASPYTLPGGAGLTSPTRLFPAGGDLSAALASLSSHANQLRGFMADQNITLS